VLGLLAATVAAAWAGSEMPTGAKSSVVTADAKARLATNSLRFVENAGQWDARGKYLFRTSNLNYWVTGRGLVLDYTGTSKSNSKIAGQAIRVDFVGGNLAEVSGVSPKSLLTDYVTDAKKVTNVKSYSEVVSKGLYPGVDLRSYIDNASPRYDLIVAAGANPAAIKMKFTGANGVAISPKGELTLKTELGDKKQVGLKAFQTIDGKQAEVSVAFTKLAADQVGFRLGKYDKSVALTIDPLIYGSYYGGDDGPDEVHATASDTDGGVYMTGRTRAPKFPAIVGPYGFNLAGEWDAFVTKLQGDAYLHDYAAYVGGALNDSGDRIQLDPFGNLWIAGKTESSNFPGNPRENVQFIAMTTSFPNIPNSGTFTVSYGGVTSARIPYNATPTEVQVALENISTIGVGKVKVTLDSGAGGINNTAVYRVALANDRPLRLSINSTRLGAIYLIARRPAGQAQLVTNETGTPTAGTFLLQFNGETTLPLPFNATAGAIEAALAQLPSIRLDGTTDNIDVVSAATPTDPTRAPYIIIFKNRLGTAAQPTVLVDNTNLTGGAFAITPTTRWAVSWDKTTSRPTGGFFQVAFGGQVATVPFNANAALYEARLQALTSIGQGNVKVQSEPNGFATLPDGNLVATFVGNLVATNAIMQISDALLIPKPIYTPSKFSDIFVIRFKKSGSSLSPLPTRTQMFGGDRNETLAGFSIVPKDNPTASDPVRIALAGNAVGRVPDIPGAVTGSSFYTRYTFTETGRFKREDASSKYFADTVDTNIGGLVTDSEGSIFVTGTVFNSGVVDTSLNPVFVTTNRAFEGGRLLRNNDLFVRKYDQAGNLVYSVLVGGNNNETIGGLDYSPEGLANSYGSAVAVDNIGNAYITGMTTSFNYPRTRGVYGEVFDNNRNVVVTKLNSDGSEIVYSTNLRTAGEVTPAGIAVDLAGNAYITGNIHPVANFPDTAGANPTDPNEPRSTATGRINVTGDAIDPTYEMPASPEIPTTEGWLSVLNSTATRLLYGTYLGGILDDMVYGPFVDRFGDVWVSGWTDASRFYILFGDASFKVYSTSASLPSTLITPLAFKAQGDAAGSFGLVNLFGLMDPNNNYALGGPNPQASPLQGAKPRFSVTLQRDGFVVRQRVAFPGVQELTVDPSTAPGGLGTVITGSLTLSSPAPNGGAEITFELNNSGASFDSVNFVNKVTRVIPAGGTAVTIQVFTRAVSLNTSVQLRAGYLGSFKIAQFVVIPWLSQLSLTPTEVVGGGNANGTITLAAPAPAGGVVVDLLTDSPDLISFPDGAQATIPAGQTTGNFAIATNGVSVAKFPKVTASLLGVGKTQTLTVLPIALQGLTFAPSRIAGGSTTVGTVAFTGKAGIDFNLKVSLDAGTAGYTFQATAAGPKSKSIILPVKKGDTQATFLLNSVFEPINTKRVATAVRLDANNVGTGPSVNGTLFIDAVQLTTFTLAPTTVEGGDDASGVVSIGSPAPDGGVVINLKSSSTKVATVPATVTVPAGQTSASFTVSTSTLVGRNATVTITASRGSVSIPQTLNVTGTSFKVAVAPVSVVGGSQNSVGTVTLQKPAPAGGVSVSLTSSATSAATVPSTAVIAEGETSVTFPITSKVVLDEVTVTITSRIGTTDATATLIVKPISLVGFTITPNQLRPFKNAVGVVTLEAPAPKGGTKVTLTLDTSVFAVYPQTLSLTVLEGQTTAQFTLQSKRFSIPFQTTVSATAGSGSKSVVVSILR